MSIYYKFIQICNYNCSQKGDNLNIKIKSQCKERTIICVKFNLFWLREILIMTFWDNNQFYTKNLIYNIILTKKNRNTSLWDTKWKSELIQSVPLISWNQWNFISIIVTTFIITITHVIFFSSNIPTCYIVFNIYL